MTFCLEKIRSYLYFKRSVRLKFLCKKNENMKELEESQEGELTTQEGGKPCKTSKETQTAERRKKSDGFGDIKIQT